MRGITEHQMEVLKLVSASPTPMDLDQVLEKVSWGPSKEALQFTIRTLVKKKMLEKLPLKLRRGRLRVSFQVIGNGHLVLAPLSQSDTPGLDQDQENGSLGPILAPEIQLV